MSAPKLHLNYERVLRLREEAKTILDLYPEKRIQAFTGNLEALLEELSVFQIELEMQNDELRDLHSQLESTQKRYRTFYQSAPVGLCFLNRNGFIRSANPAAINILSIDNLASMAHGHFSLTPLIHARDVGHFVQAVRRASETRRECCILRVRGKNETEKRVQFCMRLLDPSEIEEDAELLCSLTELKTVDS